MTAFTSNDCAGMHPRRRPSSRRGGAVNHGHGTGFGCEDVMAGSGIA